MKILSRDFTLKEKILILALVIVLLGIAYYALVHVPVTDALKTAAAEKSALEIELSAVTIKVAQLEKMKNEMDSLSSDGTLKMMPSYNNLKEINKLLNDVLGEREYTISLQDPVAEGDLVRRELTLQFKAPSYSDAEKVLNDIVCGEFRCLIGDVRCQPASYSRTGVYYINASANITFYETMVGGKADSALIIKPVQQETEEGQN